ncbi:MAG: outer membrane protein assembly factor BamD [Myxococcaceae bacterium]|nr:outer membrane protein assembly factor BamD [Myxococcaceae bacterium]
MSELRPWKDGDDQDRAAQLVRLVSGIAPRPVDVGKGWDGVIERVARPKSSRLLWFAAATAAVLLAWVSLRWEGEKVAAPVPVRVAEQPKAEPAPSPPAPAPEQRIEPEEAPAPPPAPVKVAKVVVEKPAPAPEPVVVEPEPTQENKDVVASSGAVWSTPLEGTFKLERGRVEVAPHAEAYTVTTPEVSVVATNARYAADVTEAGTVVRVLEGEVEVFSFATKQPVIMRAGEERTFATFAPPSALDVVPPEVSSPACARHSLDQRVACLQLEAKGQGMKAQAALYEAAYLQSRAGSPASAELLLRESLRRFPNGVLHPEARLALIKALEAQHRRAQAAEVARDFLEVCPDDPRVVDVQNFLRALEWLESR